MLLPLRKKVTISFILILSVVFIAIGSLVLTSNEDEGADKPNQNEAVVSGYPHVITDDYGREVTIKARPLKVVTLAPSITEMLFALDFGDRVQAVTEWCNRPAEVTQLPNVGRIDAPNLEVILELHPDLILGTELTPRSLYDKLTKMGYTCMAFKHDNLQDVMKDAQTIAAVLGDAKTGQIFAERIQADLTDTIQRLKTVEEQPKRRVALLFDINNLFSVGKNTWLGDLVTTCHAVNIGDAAPSSWPKLTMEGVLESNPDVILVTDATDASGQELLRLKVASLKDDPAWKNVAAVSQGRVFILENNGEYMIPGPRMIDAFKGIARGIYPECFTEQ